MSTIRAVGLISGGLDSALAARLMLDQGVAVVGLHLESPTACRSDPRAVAAELGIPLEIRAKGDAYLRLLRRPRFGYGRHMNPCVDCRSFMFALGREEMERSDASFLFTGEVVGQRPMSQTRANLDRIDRDAGLAGLVLRPLSARLLAETEPERRGRVDRARLLAISGRARHEQLRLAARYGLTAHGSPGGGCLLTDAHFSSRLRDYFGATAEPDIRLEDVALLAIGRHVRVADDVKIVLGRDENENRRLAASIGPGRWLVEPAAFRGPTALVCGPRDEHALGRAIALVSHHAPAARPDDEVRWIDGEATGLRRVGGPLQAAPPTAESPMSGGNTG
jgi:hypothetical protein